MKKIAVIAFAIISSTLFAQNSFPITRNSSLTAYNGLKISSKKGTLIEKQIFNIGKFKNLNIQKIVFKDTSDNSTENVLGIMTEFETFDNISKRTLTIEKTELSKIIQSLQTLEQRQNENKISVETKYKFVAMNDIEFGSVFNENKNWSNYIRLPFYQNLIEFNKDELKELNKILKNVEQSL